jgi:putative flavoprotein involved in K+ transport
MTLPSTSDPRAAAQAVLDALNQGLAAEKSEAVAGLFADESYWRDLVLFTWNLKTMEGPAQITEMLRHQLSPALPVRFELDPKETVEEAGGVVSAWLTIDTRLARAPVTCA